MASLFSLFCAIGQDYFIFMANVPRLAVFLAQKSDFFVNEC